MTRNGLHCHHKKAPPATQTRTLGYFTDFAVIHQIMTPSTPAPISLALAAQFRDCLNNEIGDSDLQIAAFEGNETLIKEILSLRPPREVIDKRNHWGCTALRLAATEGHFKCVELLLQHGATVDISDVKGQSPLQVAVKNGHCECAELLLKTGADPNGDSAHCSSPLCIASMNGNLKMVKLLIKYNAAIVLQKRSLVGRMFTVDPLQRALAYHHYDCLKVLLGTMGRLLQQYKSHHSFIGITSLYHLAVKHKCKACFVELMYEFGLNPWIRDARQLYPWDVGREFGSGDAFSEETLDLMMFFKRIQEQPRSLRSCCRLSIWRHVISLGRKAKDLKKVHGVPDSVKKYLMFKTMF